MIRAAKIKLICSTYLPVINTDNKYLINEEVTDTKKIPKNVIKINLRNCPFFLKINFL